MTICIADLQMHLCRWRNKHNIIHLKKLNMSSREVPVVLVTGYLLEKHEVIGG